MNSANIFIGTSGWSYNHWSGIFYPSDLDARHYLEFYLTQFDCVELNSSFYHLPFKSTVEGWMRRTPENFRFCLKLSRYITHQLQLINSEPSLVKFFNVFERMKSRLGPVLIQLPPQMTYEKSLITDFLDLLKRNYPEYRFAFEVRHKSWLNDAFFSLLSEYKVAFVMADSGNRYPYDESITTDIVYLRFHGREQLYASDYSLDILKDYAVKIQHWSEGGNNIWIFFNNDFNGYAVKNAKELKNLLAYF